MGQGHQLVPFFALSYLLLFAGGVLCSATEAVSGMTTILAGFTEVRIVSLSFFDECIGDLD